MGNIYVGELYPSQISKIDPNQNKVLVVSGLNTPWGVAVSSTNTLYFTENGQISKFQANLIYQA